MAQLERLCESGTFKNSSRLCQFLRYTVEATLKEEGEYLKEYVIGTEVYGRRPPYHPSQDSIVRTEAVRLRNKLKEYYETEGAQDEVLIYYQRGTYRPNIRLSAQMPKETTAASAKSSHSGTTEHKGVTIAVLPFRHQEGETLTAAIAAGVTDELTFLIAETDGCQVLAAPSVALAEAHIADAAFLGDALKVDQIITGSVRKDASHVRVSVTGVHPSGLETWSERFDLTITDKDLIFLEEQTAMAIMARIAPQTSKIRNKKVRVSPAILSALPDFLSAESALDHGTSSSVRSALAKFQHLAQHGPESPRIHCGIAQCYYSLIFLGEPVEAADLQQARTAATKALELDPEMAEAHAAMGCCLVLSHNLKSAEDHHRHALSLGASPGVRQRYADLLMMLGRFDEASLQLRAAWRLDPFSCRQRVSTARLKYLLSGTSEHPAIPEDAVPYGPVPNQVLLFQAELLLQMKRAEEAAALAEAILLTSDESPSILSGVAGILALAGRTEGAWALIAGFHLLDQRASLSRTCQARLCMCLQDEEGCENFLKLAVAVNEPQVAWLETDPRFGSMRERAIYKRAVRSILKPAPVVN